MKRKKIREILIEVEKIRVIRKRSSEKKPDEKNAKENLQFEIFGCGNAFAKNTARLEHLFDKLF